MVLFALLARHPDLRPEAVKAANAALTAVDFEGVADSVADAALRPEFDDLNGRAGRDLGRYVTPGEAAWEILHEEVEPFLAIGVLRRARPDTVGEPMTSIARNEACPCGSGKKYKKCCLAKAAAGGGFTKEDRASAIERLDAFTAEALGAEDDAAYNTLIGEYGDRWPDVDDGWDEIDEAFHDAWFWFDWPLTGGRTAADRFIAERPPLSAGERRYLDVARASCMRLYEVEDTRPGLSVTLRDVLDGARVTVRERMGSRTMSRADLLAARVLPRGASGEPEMEMGVLSIPKLIRGSLVAQLSSMRGDFRKENPDATEIAFWKSAAPVLHDAWVSCILDPPVPALANTDGEPMLFTRVHYLARDPLAVARLLDDAPELERDAERSRWRWSGRRGAGKLVLLGTLALDGTDLVLEANSAERGRRGREMLEGVCAGSVEHRATSHEDPTRGIQDALRAGGGDDAEHDDRSGIPPEVLDDLTLAHYGRHYRAWVDEPVPALDGKTPREGATSPAMRARVEALIRDLEGMYQQALRRNEPAYDPSWMWTELGLVDAAGPAQLPLLHHARMGQMVEGFGDCARSVAARLRGPTGEVAGTFTREQLAVDLDVRRFLRDAKAASADGAGSDGALARHLACVINFEVWRRKTFWVDESLAFLLARTDLDVLGRDLRLPFDCLAVVFTDRHVLSMAERLLARDPNCPVAGSFLRVATVYVTEETIASGRQLRLVFALDALGADAPYLLEHPLAIDDDASIDLPDAGEPVVFAVDGEDLPPPLRPWRGLVQVVLNAIVYATSAGVEPTAPPGPRAQATTRSETPSPISDEIYYLPGAIPISKLRQMQDLERAPGGRGLMHRFLVRGHWRRPSAGWKVQRMRWISPYWKGPDLAAVVERAYKLKP